MPADGTDQLRTKLKARKRSSRSLQLARCRVQVWVLTIAILLYPDVATPGWAQTAPSVEYQVKAAFLLNFVKFIEWPADAFQDNKAPITICVFGHDPFGSALDNILRGKTIENREVLPRRMSDISDLKSCQLVFVSALEDKRLPEILSSLKGTSALVVGETESFAERGGGIQFFLDDNRLRFAVNVDAVRRARLEVSSKLLALARIVHA
ncbi:MAG: YfiR family protein [Candidatus Acidiferrales bacterium]|jgi:hypothetical protein